MDVRRSVAIVFVALAACSGGGGEPTGTVIEVQAAPQAEARSMTPKKGSSLGRGAMVEIYGADADPLPVQFRFGASEVDGQEVLQVDMVVEVTIDAERVERRWRILAGTAVDGQPAVLRATRR